MTFAPRTIPPRMIGFSPLCGSTGFNECDCVSPLAGDWSEGTVSFLLASTFTPCRICSETDIRQLSLQTVLKKRQPQTYFSQCYKLWHGKGEIPPGYLCQTLGGGRGDLYRHGKGCEGWGRIQVQLGSTSWWIGFCQPVTRGQQDLAASFKRSGFFRANFGVYCDVWFHI